MYDLAECAWQCIVGTMNGPFEFHILIPPSSDAPQMSLASCEYVAVVVGQCLCFVLMAMTSFCLSFFSHSHILIVPKIDHLIPSTLDVKNMDFS